MARAFTALYTLRWLSVQVGYSLYKTNMLVTDEVKPRISFLTWLLQEIKETVWFLKVYVRLQL